MIDLYYKYLNIAINVSLKKIKAILLYFCHNTDPKFLGKVKLMKLSYFLDFMHLKTYGSPVTYDTYVNLDHGPIPSFILNMVNDAADDIDSSELADTIHFEKPAGTHMCRILPKRKFADQDKNTKYLEDISHKEAPWTKTGYLNEIPYTLAAKDKDCLVPEEDIKLLMDIL